MDKGFTLLEVMISLMVFSLVGLMLMSSFSISIKSARMYGKSALLHKEVRYSLNLIGKDIFSSRQVIALPENGIGLRKANDELVFYKVFGKDFYRITLHGSKKLGTNIDNLEIQLYNLDGGLITDYDSAVFIKVRIDGSFIYSGKLYKDAAETKIRMRNNRYEI